MIWTETEEYIMGDCEKVVKTNFNVASFDLDDTLITSTSGKFSSSSTDWKLYNECIPDRLNNFIKQGYTIVIFSNQKGISSGKVDKKTWMEKIEKFAKLVNVPFTIIASLGDNKYRKPLPNMWYLVDGNKSKSFFCGDAGGLPGRMVCNEYIDKDFSDTDLKFALNLGIPFIHRDELIFGVKQTCIPNYPKLEFDKRPDFNYTFNEPTVVINVGCPGSGKSYFTSKFPNASVINQDTLKTAAKCLSTYKTCLKKKDRLIIIDNTNPSKDKRKVFIDLAKDNGYDVVCYYFTTPLDVSKHNNYYRWYTSGVKLVPSIAYNMYKKHFTIPTIVEGFSKIYTIDFANEKDDPVYYMYFY